MFFFDTLKITLTPLQIFFSSKGDVRTIFFSNTTIDHYYKANDVFVHLLCLLIYKSFYCSLLIHICKEYRDNAYTKLHLVTMYFEMIY